MSWFFLALLSPFFWAIVTLLDDNLLRNVYRSPYFATAISGLLGAVPVFSLAWGSLPTSGVAALAMLSGMLVVVFYYLYFLSFESEQPSVISALFNLIPALVPFLSYAFLHEKLKGYQYIGLVVVILASFAISAVDIKRFKFSKALYLMICGGVLYAISEVIAKYLYSKETFIGVYAFTALGMGLGGLFFAFAFEPGKNFFKTLFGYKKKIIALLVLAELVNIIALFFHNAAISRGPVAGVTAIEGIQAAYVLILAIAFYPVWPKFFREAAEGGVLKKLSFMALMLVGLYLIYI